LQYIFVAAAFFVSPVLMSADSIFFALLSELSLSALFVSDPLVALVALLPPTAAVACALDVEVWVANDATRVLVACVTGD
jgi:hypothetical protein